MSLKNKMHCTDVNERTMTTDFLDKNLPPNSLVKVATGKKEGNSLQWHSIVARVDVKQGDTLLSETPLFGVTNLTMSKGDQTVNAVETMNYQPEFRIEDTDYLEGRKDCASFFLFAYEKLLADERNLVTTNTSWMQEFCTNADSRKAFSGLYQNTITAIKIKLRRKFPGRDIKKYLVAAKKFYALYTANRFKVVTAIGNYQTGVAVYRWSSYLNHSCKPNASYFMGKGAVIHVQATRDIKAGEEVRISYLSTPSSVFVGLRPDVKEIGFACQCGHCGQEDSFLKAVQQGQRNARTFKDLIVRAIECFNLPARIPEALVAIDTLCAMKEDLVNFLSKSDHLAVIFCDCALHFIVAQCVMNNSKKHLIRMCRSLVEILGEVQQQKSEGDGKMYVSFCYLVILLVGAGTTWSERLHISCHYEKQFTPDDKKQIQEASDHHLKDIATHFDLCLLETTFCYFANDKTLASDILAQAFIYCDISHHLWRALMDSLVDDPDASRNETSAS